MPEVFNSLCDTFILSCSDSFLNISSLIKEFFKDKKVKNLVLQLN